MARAQRLSDKGTDPQTLLDLVKEVRERIEIVHSSEYRNFLECYFPAFEALLAVNVTPQFEQGHLNRVRFIVLEILNRLPSSELLKPYIVKLLRLTMSILAVDNQENALVCLKIIFSLHKNFRPMLKEYVPEFLKFVQSLYTNLEATRVILFKLPAAAGSHEVGQGQPASSSSSSSASSAAAAATDAATAATATAAASPPAAASHLLSTESTVVSMKSTCSFKVVTECPLIVMLLFQLYPEYVKEHVKIFIPLMISALNLDPPHIPPNTPVHTALRARFSEMVACQVKTLSFLTYLLKGFKQQMQPYEKLIAKAVVELLKRCPAKAVATRKELLVATRHILATDFRKGFFQYVNILLNENILMGTGRQSR
jgi:transformation/transcription domain-associated protein